MSAFTAQGLLDEAQRELPRAVELRRRIHRWPEVGLLLPRTQEAVLEALEDVPVEIETGTKASSVIATLRGARPGPVVMLRADMDALPIAEPSVSEFASERNGLMHACGHDAHVAMLVGAARVLARHLPELAGCIRLVFQPGEEGHHGARVMIDEGLLDAEPPVDAAFALHVVTGLDTGRVAACPGVALASMDDFTITLVGRSGHAGAPHWAADPVPAACELVLAIQALVTRRIDAFDPAVVTVTRIDAGDAFNVVASQVVLRGTARAVSEQARQTLLTGIERLATGIAAAHELEALVEIADGYPLTHNDPELTNWALDVARSVVRPEWVHLVARPSMSAEDFSYVLQRVPGAMLLVGCGVPGVEDRPTVHSSAMVLDEDAMATGIALHAALALEYVTTRSGNRPPP